MAPWSSRKKKGHDADAVAEGEAKPGSTNAKEASDEGSVKPPAIARAPSASRHKPSPHHPVKLSRPPLPFLFALFLNQLYINLIVLVPRQVGIYIIRTRFLPQDDPAAQLTGERGDEEFFRAFFEDDRGGGGTSTQLAFFALPSLSLPFAHQKKKTQPASSTAP